MAIYLVLIIEAVISNGKRLLLRRGGGMSTPGFSSLVPRRIGARSGGCRSCRRGFEEEPQWVRVRPPEHEHEHEHEAESELRTAGNGGGVGRGATAQEGEEEERFPCRVRSINSAPLARRRRGRGKLSVGDDYDLLLLVNYGYDDGWGRRRRRGDALRIAMWLLRTHGGGEELTDLPPSVTA